MLKELAISNYALIDQTDLDLDNGLTIITGETGAGKSIMLGALGLILGQRADVQVLLDKEKKCVVEATFDVSKLQLEPLFEAEGADYDPITIIRREILPNGKSRAFVNDSPANVSFLKEIGQKLIDIHSQHQNLLLSSDTFHLKVIDAVAQTEQQLSDYTQSYNEYKQLVQKEKNICTNNESLKQEADYMQFQYNELSAAKLQSGEMQQLEAEHSTLVNAEEIKEALSFAIEELGGDEKIISVLGNMSNKLCKIQNYLPSDTDATNRIETAKIDLADLLKTLEQVSDRIEYNPTRIAEIDQRIDLIYNLLKKHHVSEVDQLIAIQNDLAEKLKAVSNFDIEIEELRKQIEKQRTILAQKADALTQKRKTVFEQITHNIESDLHDMGIHNAKFVVSHSLTPDFAPSGQDDIRFLFAANKNSEPSDIAKVASGGEMSRLMLSIKSLLSKSTALPTIIFDEIDTGVSGEVADKMGSIMTEMAQNMQVIAITHLPQVAAKGNTHYKVFKHDIADRTISDITLLSNEQRIEELAKMLSGTHITDAALQNAKELLGQ